MDKLKKDFDQLLFVGRDLSSEDFERKLDAFLADKTEDEKRFISDYYVTVLGNKLNEYKEVTEEIAILEQLDGMEEFVNMAKLASTYFGKSKSWLYQRLHGHAVHGKPAKFTEEERKTLSDALLSLSENLKTVALKIA